MKTIKIPVPVPTADHKSEDLDEVLPDCKCASCITYNLLYGPLTGPVKIIWDKGVSSDK